MFSTPAPGPSKKIKRTEQDSFECAQCNHKTDNYNTWKSHKNRVHGKTMYKRERNQKPVVHLPPHILKQIKENRLENQVAEEYRNLLHENRLSDLDGLPEATPQQIEDLIDKIRTDVTGIKDGTAHHIMCQDLSNLDKVVFVDRVLDVSNECFCNHCVMTNNVSAHLNGVLSNRDSWHRHGIVVLKPTKVTPRAVNDHFRALYPTNRYYYKKAIENMDHLINIYLYILRRRSSKNGIMSHVHQSTGYYITQGQIEYIRNQLSDLIKGDLEESEVPSISVPGPSFDPSKDLVPYDKTLETSDHFIPAPNKQRRLFYILVFFGPSIGVTKI